MKWADPRLCSSVFVCAAIVASAQTTSSTSTQSHSKAKKPGSHAAHVAPASRKSSSHTVRSRRPAAPAFQLHPDPERYQEIQKALADKGYFKGEVNGVWGDDSVDAMKRFQADQKLEPDGKINALTLIGLGLGPKHDGTAGSAPAVTSSTPSTPNPH